MYHADGASPVYLASVSPRVPALEQMNNKHNGGCESGEHQSYKALRPIVQSYKTPTQECLRDTQTHRESIHTDRHKSTLTVLRNLLCQVAAVQVQSNLSSL